MQSSAALPLESAPDAAADEAALVQAARQDSDAFGTLYLRYLDRMYRYVRTRTATEDDAADLVQQVSPRALTALPHYRDQKAPFAAWLFRIARNAAIDANRRHQTTVPWDLLPEELQGGPGQGVDAGVMQQVTSVIAPLYDNHGDWSVKVLTDPVMTNNYRTYTDSVTFHVTVP